MEKDCGDYLVGLNDPIADGMSVVFSSWYDATGAEDFELDYHQTHSSTCDDASNTIENFQINRWVTTEDPADDGTNPDDDTKPDLIIDEVADSLDMCNDDMCTACHMAHYSNETTNRFPVCTDYTSYKYSNKCGKNQDPSKCGDFDDCFRSWPHSDARKWKSDDFACRPLPLRLIEGEFTYARR